MPAYDYRCAKCEDVFEVVRPLGETADVHCPVCSVPAKRVFSPVGVVFKGSGFHNTDYRAKSSKDSTSEKPAPCGADKPASKACGGCAAAEV